MAYDKDYFESGNISNYKGYSNDPYYEKRASMFKEIFDIHRALDIGCAKGFQVLGFHKNGVEAYGVDISEYALSQAPREIGNKLKVVDLNSESLPFQSNFFDFVYCSEIIEHITALDNLLSEIRRVLQREKGNLYITTPEPNSPGAINDKTHVNVHDFPFWEALLKKHGFQSKRIQIPPVIYQPPYKAVIPKSLRIRVAENSVKKAKMSYDNNIFILAK